MISTLSGSYPPFKPPAAGPTDWFYRNLVPKDAELNCRWRRWLLENAYADDEFARECWIICARDILFYLNSFGWLLEPREKTPWNPAQVFGSLKKIPFITRSYQDKYILEALQHIGTKDIVVSKSRELGASWMFLYITDHFWRFTPEVHIGLVSRDEQTVCAHEDPSSLFAKLDFIDENLPMFLRPTRNAMISENTIKNVDNNSTIVGAAATKDAFRSGRLLFVIQDEAHFFPQGDDEAVHDSLRGVTYSRVLISTVNRARGQTGQFHAAVLDEKSQAVKIVMDWKDDPEKAAGLYTSEFGRLEILDKSYDFDDRYPFILDGKVRSPYYDWEWKRVGVTPASIAAELDRDFGGASARFFDAEVIEWARKLVVDPYFKGQFMRDGAHEFFGSFEIMTNGDCEFWLHMDTDEYGNPTPPRNEQFVLGADISAGTGGSFSSYSAIVIFSKQTGEQVFQSRVNTMKPDKFARYVVAVGKFFNNALVVPEVTGTVGQLFLSEFMTLNYPNPYFREAATGQIATSFTGKVGLDNKDGGEKILGAMQAAMRERKCIPRSEQVVKELERYFRDEQGKLKHPLVGGGRRDAPERSHGDCAIAAAGAWWGMRETLLQPHVEDVDLPPPWGSWAWSRQQHAKEAKRAPSWWDPLPTSDGPGYADAVFSER